MGYNRGDSRNYNRIAAAAHAPHNSAKQAAFAAGEAAMTSGCGAAEARWAQSRAITISPPTSCSAISRPAAPTSRPISTRAARWTYGQLADRVARFGAALRGARHPARRARADGAARHHRLADRVSRLPQGRHHRRAGQHAADRGRLPLHAGRQPRQLPGGVGGAVSEIREADRQSPDLEHVIVSGDNAARLSAVRGSDRRRRAGGLHRADHRATTLRSGSTPRARPASRRARCMCTPASSSPPISTARRSPA